MPRLLFLLLLFLSSELIAQTKYFQQKEKEIARLSEIVYSSKSDKEKMDAHNLMVNELYEVLSNPKSNRYTFDKLKRIIVLEPKDKKLRLFTWAISLNNGNFFYGGIFHYYDKKQRAQVVHVLKDRSYEIADPEKKTFTPDYWYGSLYYDIIAEEYNGTTYYTLLGWDGYTKRSSKKIADVLWFDRSKRPYFGAPLFVSNKGIQNRFILEFNSLSSVKLSYYPKKEIIVFDHLAPVDGESFHVKSSYVPTSEFYGFTFKKGKWSLVKNVDVGELK